MDGDGELRFKSSGLEDGHARVSPLGHGLSSRRGLHAGRSWCQGPLQPALKPYLERFPLRCLRCCRLLDKACEDYGMWVAYKGSVDGCPDTYIFDMNHKFVKVGTWQGCLPVFSIGCGRLAPSPGWEGRCLGHVVWCLGHASLTSSLTSSRQALRPQHSFLCVSRSEACLSQHKRSSVLFQLAPGFTCPRGPLSVPPCKRLLTVGAAT